MKCKHLLLMFIIHTTIQLCQSIPHTRKVRDKNIHKYTSKTGEPIAVTHLIQEYERDHLYLYEKEAHKDNLLEWKALDNKNLDNYCRSYLHQTVPVKSTSEAIGSKRVMKLHYTISGYDEFLRNIVVVTCEYQIGSKVMLHLTQALEPNCVYALNRRKGHNFGCSTFKIVNKHCNFEQYDYTVKKKRYRKREDRKVSHLHHTTGQYIAHNEAVINELELEHQELHKKEADKNNCIQWPFIISHGNLNEYCHKYLKACVLNRKIEGAVGSWSLQKLHWRSNNEKIVIIVVVKCHISEKNYERNYYFTKALDPNCVYALIRIGKHSENPFLIIFKHCKFDIPNTVQEISSSINDADLIHKKIKTEDLPIIETLQLFPNS